jgi:DNA-binding transcriptional LysR family regulator
MDLNLDDAALFTRIVALGTLSAAARERDVPVSQVTRALARLESRCGARLLHRTTHGLSLTDEGDTFLAHAAPMLEAAAELQGALASKRAGPSGRVRISVSTVIAQAVIAPSLPALVQRHPLLQLDISADDRLADMARDGIDIAIRAGSPASDTVVARPLGQLTRRLYASRAYAARHGLPRSVAALERHHLIGNSATPSMNRWRLGRDDAHAQVFEARGRTRTDNTAVVLALVREGVGIGRVIDLVAEPLVAAGELVPVLPALAAAEPPVPVFAVMLQERHRLPKLRACIDHWAQWLDRHAQQRALANARAAPPRHQKR